MKTCVKLLGLLVVPALVISANAANLCVGPSATGDGSGNDWNNKMSWSSSFVRGNTYFLEDGAYSAKSLNTPVSGTTVIVIKKATVADHVTNVGWTDSMGDGQATFGNVMSISTPNWVFDGVVGSGFDANNYGFRLLPPSNCGAEQTYFSIGTGSQTISNITIAHTTAKACPDDVQKTFFYIQPGVRQYNHTYTNILSDGMQGTWFMLGLENCWIENCFLTNHASTSLHHGDIVNLRIANGPCRNVTVKNCIFADYYGTGAIVANDGGSDGLVCVGLNVYGCVFGPFRGGAGSGGNGVICCTTRSAFQNVNIFNNTFYQNGNPWLQVAMPASSAFVKNSCVNIVAKNNIIYSGYTGIGDDATQPVQHDYNTYVSSSGPNEAHGIVTSVSPFVNAAAKDFRLVSAMAGEAMSAPFDVDRNGLRRGSDGVWDRGALEFNSGVVAPVISVAPTALNFGSVFVNSNRDLTVTVQNVGAGTLAGTASVGAPFSIVSNGTYSLGPFQSRPVIVRYSPTTTSSNSLNIIFTGGGGANVPVSGTGRSASANTAPAVSSIAQNATDVDSTTPGMQVFEGMVVQYSGSASDADGDPMTWKWIYTVNGGAEVVYQSGSGAVTPVSFNYSAGTGGKSYRWKLRVTDGMATSESQLSVDVKAPPAVGERLSLEAESGVITSPFVMSGGSISQTTTTDLAGGGRAVYSFSVTNAGQFVIQAYVNAPSLTENSFYLNIDAEPQDPVNAWDILPPTVGFENRLVSWRGSGTADANEFVPKIFTLVPGVHTLIVRGRESDVQLDRFEILKLLSPPQNLRVVAQ
jgi:hypothetical protein